jgi:hypothetical protein
VELDAMEWRGEGDASGWAAAQPCQVAVQPPTNYSAAPDDRAGKYSPPRWRRQRRVNALPAASVPRARKVSDGRAARGVGCGRRMHVVKEGRDRMYGESTFLWGSCEQATY